MRDVEDLPGLVGRIRDESTPRVVSHGRVLISRTSKSKLVR